MPAAIASWKNPSKNGVRTLIMLVICCRPHGSSGASISAALMSPPAHLARKSIPTARTSGSANGSSITGLSAFVAIARAAATIVAVAPTLEARSQVSLSVRGMRRFSNVGNRFYYLDSITNRAAAARSVFDLAARQDAILGRQLLLRVVELAGNRFDGVAVRGGQTP